MMIRPRCHRLKPKLLNCSSNRNHSRWELFMFVYLKRKMMALYTENNYCKQIQEELRCACAASESPAWWLGVDHESLPGLYTVHARVGQQTVNGPPGCFFLSWHRRRFHATRNTLEGRIIYPIIHVIVTLLFYFLFLGDPVNRWITTSPPVSDARRCRERKVNISSSTISRLTKRYKPKVALLSNHIR